MGVPDYPVRYSVQLDEATADKLVDVAREQDRSVAQILRQAVYAYIDAQTRKKPSSR